MEYLRYIAVLRQRFLLIIVLVALGAGSSAYFAFRQPKIYSATATLLINPAAPNSAIPYLTAVNGAGSGLQQLASTYDAYIHSTTFLKKVIENLGLSIADTPGVLSSEITTAEVGDTNFMRITVVAQDPLFTQRVANGVANIFIAQNLVLQQAQQQNAQYAQNAQLAQSLQSQISSVSALDAQLSKAADANTPAGQATLASVETRLNNLLAAQKTLSSQTNGINNQQLNTAALTDPAGLPALPISPNIRQSIVFGTILGLVIGVMLAFLLDYLDYTMRTPEDVERSTGQLPLAVISITEAGHTRARGLRSRQRGGLLSLFMRRSTSPRPRAVASPATALVVQSPAMGNGVVPLLSHNGNGSVPAAWAGLPQPALVSLQSPHDPVSEAFRALRTNLAFSTLAQPARSLSVTSMLPGEGKSTISANLATVLAQSGKRVILIDTDLRRPSIHRIFNIKNVNGFTDVLLGNCDLVDSLHQTVVPNLRVLTSGTLPLNPAELLSSDAIAPLLEALSAQADMLIFDTPPMGVLTDAVVLSTRLEGTLLVVRAGSSRPNTVANGLESLRKIGARPLGVVLNMVDVSSLRAYSSYYYYYSYYSQGGYYSEPAQESQVGSVTG